MNLSLNCLFSAAFFYVVIESRVVDLLIASIMTSREPADVDTTGVVNIEPTEAGTTDVDNSELTETF